MFGPQKYILYYYLDPLGLGGLRSFDDMLTAAYFGNEGVRHVRLHFFGSIWKFEYWK